jgi:hypothetical protein
MQQTVKAAASRVVAPAESQSSANAHFRRLGEALSNVYTRASQAFAFLHLAVDATRSEIRSLVPRIGYIRSYKLDQFLRFGKMVEVRPDQSLAPNRRTHARIRDTQLLQQNLPWVTVVDCHLFLEGWNKGYEFGIAHHNSCTQAEDIRVVDSSAGSPSDQKSQDMTRPIGQISTETAAAIAGVSHKV